MENGIEEESKQGSVLISWLESWNRRQRRSYNKTVGLQCAVVEVGGIPRSSQGHSERKKIELSAGVKEYLSIDMNIHHIPFHTLATPT